MFHLAAENNNNMKSKTTLIFTILIMNLASQTIFINKGNTLVQQENCTGAKNFYSDIEFNHFADKYAH